MVTQLDIYRGGSLLASVEIDANTVYQREFMGMDKVTAQFILPTPLLLGIDDYIEYQGRKYSVKQPPTVEHNRFGYKHEVIFYGELFSWYDKILMDEGDALFSYTGTPFDFLTLILDNIQEFDSSWSFGDVALIDEPLTLSFEAVSCFQSLVQVADAFNLEYYVVGKKIYLVENAGRQLDITLEYGRGKGLYTLSRKSVDEAFATEWYGFGGTQNLPSDYPKSRLTLPSPIQRNISLYGRKQGVITFEHIFPRYVGTVSSTPNEFSIIDTNIDFPLTPIADGSAKIVFKTGDLGGNEFTITGWDENTGTIRFGVKKEESGYELPNDAVHAAIGDEYTIVGVHMPPEYLSAALNELNEAVVDHAEKNSHPKVAYDLVIDRNYIREMGISGMINPGDRLRIKDQLMSVDNILRIQNVTWPLVSPSSVTATISESVQYTFQERIAKDAIEGKKKASKAQTGALFARQVADEIANAVILHQFNRTYIGDRAVLTGAFVAGNPEDGEVAGINGTESGTDKVRFWAGASFANKDSAPFRVLQNGNIYSTAGYIGGFKILTNSLESYDSYNGGKFVLYPTNGFIAFINSEEGVWAGIGENVMPVASGVVAVGRFENKIEDEFGTNFGINIDVSGGMTNIAINVANGDIRMGGGKYTGLAGRVKNVNTTSYTATNDDDYLFINTVSDTTITLPSSPKSGKILRITKLNPVNLLINPNGNRIQIEEDIYTSTTPDVGWSIDMIFNDDLTEPMWIPIGNFDVAG